MGRADEYAMISDDSQDKEELVSVAAGGDLLALEQLLRVERPRVLQYIHRHFPAELKRVLEPQDVLQDTLFQAARSIRSFKSEDPDSFYRWLVTIARRCMLDMIAARRAQKRGEGKTRGDSVAVLMQDLAIEDSTPSGVLAGKELATTLEQCIGKLPADYAEAVRLRYFDALPFGEIAAKMGRSQDAVRMLCNRAMEALKSEMRSATRFL
jgi:RNA polymerase sigma-70 factor (subfamily 1)